MTQNARVPIRRLSTGIDGLDEVLGGGLPEFSFNVVAGAPGTGKTTLAHQIVFANATPQQPALYFTVQGEPPLKMLRYQQQFEFFDASMLNRSIRFVHIEEDMLEQGLGAVLECIVGYVERYSPSLIVVDSFRSLARVIGGNSERELQYFLQRLAIRLTTWEATTFLVGEYPLDSAENALFTVADGIVWLYQSVERNSMVRKLHVQKVRGQGQIPGLHTFRITSNGLQVFPRLSKPCLSRAESSPQRLSTGVSALDDMLGGDIPAGHSVLIAGPSVSGKTVLATQFISQGVHLGEPGVIATFEKQPNDYLRSTPFGDEFGHLIEAGKIELLNLRPLDLSIDEALYALRDAVLRLGARRIMIDSLSGFELALAPTFREDLRESLYRMVGTLLGLGVTVVMTVELVDSYTELKFSPHGISFLTDVIILQRYAEIEGRLERLMGVVKLRTGPHSTDLRMYRITEDGIQMEPTPSAYRGLLTGMVTSDPVDAPRLPASSGPPTRSRL